MRSLTGGEAKTEAKPDRPGPRRIGPCRARTGAPRRPRSKAAAQRAASGGRGVDRSGVNW
jgi:hypothetical protein